MADAQFDPQIMHCPGLLQPPREERLRTCLSTEEGVKSRLSKDLRSRNDRPTTRPGKTASSTDAVEKLVTVGTAGHRSIIERSKMDTELACVPEGTGVAGSEKSKHAPIPRVRHIIRAVSGGEDKLRSSTQTNQVSRVAKQTGVDAYPTVGDGIWIGSEG